MPYYKRLMVLTGDAEYELHLNKTDVLSPAQKAHVDSQYALFRAWYDAWAQSWPERSAFVMPSDNLSHTPSLPPKGIISLAKSQHRHSVS